MATEPDEDRGQFLPSQILPVSCAIPYAETGNPGLLSRDSSWGFPGTVPCGEAGCPGTSSQRLAGRQLVTAEEAPGR